MDVEEDVTGGGSVRPGWGQFTPWNWSGFWCFVEEEEDDEDEEEDDEKNNGGIGDEDGDEKAGPEYVLKRDVTGKFPTPPNGRAVRKNSFVANVVLGGGMVEEGGGSGVVVVVDVVVVLVVVGFRS